MANIKLFEYNDKKVRTSFEDGQIWFVAKDVCDVLNITWSGATLASIKSDWQRMLKFNTPLGEQNFKVISEAAVYKLAFRSNKPEAEKFTDWVAGEVIPEIRKTGRYTPKHQGVLPLALHTSVEVQKDMSKSVNAFNYQLGGVDAIMQYSIANSIAHTGKTPSQLKREGKKLGLKSKDRSSGKAVVRVTNLPAACCMSLADNLYEQGINAEKVFAVTKTAEPVFEGILKLGLTPAELKK